MYLHMGAACELVRGGMYGSSQPCTTSLDGTMGVPRNGDRK